MLLPKKIQRQTVIREKLCKTLSYKKCLRKILMKLIPGKDRPNVPNVPQYHRVYGVRGDVCMDEDLRRVP